MLESASKVNRILTAGRDRKYLFENGTADTSNDSKEINNIPSCTGFMPHIVVQIYEVQTPREADQMVHLGVDRIGSVLTSAENWKIPEIRDTIDTVRACGAQSSLIPLFTEPETIFRVIEYYRPDYVHFCETLAGANGISPSCRRLLSLQREVKNRFPQTGIMRSIPIGPPGSADRIPTLELARMFEQDSDCFLTDTFLIKTSPGPADVQPVSGFVGITGKTCDWPTAARLVRETRIPVVLAGGISPENVYDGIISVRPRGVDSCTQTNASDADGSPVRFKKDHRRVKLLVEAVRKAQKAVSCPEVNNG